MTERARRPFWIHQFAEYLMAAVLISMIFQDPEPMVPVVAGLVIMLNAAITRGPLGAFSKVPRRVHRVVDIGIMGGLVAAAVQPWVSVSPMGRLVLVAICIPYAFSWYYTDWLERPARRRRRVERGSPTSAAVGGTAGRLAGRGWNRVRHLAGGDARPDHDPPGS